MMIFVVLLLGLLVGVVLGRMYERRQVGDSVERLMHAMGEAIKPEGKEVRARVSARLMEMLR